MQVRIEHDVAVRVLALAGLERRSASQMATVLCEEALGYRGWTPAGAASQDPGQLSFDAGALAGRGSPESGGRTDGSGGMSQDPAPRAP